MGRFSRSKQKKNAGLSMNKFLEKVNNLIDKHLPIKKLSKQEILQKDKPWMTKGLITSIKLRKNTKLIKTG